MAAFRLKKQTPQLQECPHGASGPCIRCANEQMEEQDASETNYIPMQESDLTLIVRSLPEMVRNAMRGYNAAEFIVAGGFIRTLLMGQTPRDLDLFCNNTSSAEHWMINVQRSAGEEFSGGRRWSAIGDGSKITILELIWRHKFDGPAGLLDDFDLRMSKAAVWYDPTEEKWRSFIDPMFYQDNVRRELVFCNPPPDPRDLLRVFKFVQEGYSIDPVNMAKVVAHSFSAMSTLQGNNFLAVRKELEDIYTKARAITPSKTEDFSRKLAKPKKTEYYSGS